MADIFNSDFFTNNRKLLQETTEARLIVLSANGLLQRSTDTTYEFRQDSNFWYFCGVDEPDYLLVIAEEGTFLIAPKRGEHRDLWDGSIDKRAIRSVSGIDRVEEHHDGWTKLDKLLKKYKKAHTITPAEAYYDHFGFYANPARRALLDALSRHRKLEQVDIRNHIARLRQIKQDQELVAIRQAVEATSRSLMKVKKRLSKYKSENEIVADITHDFIHEGLSGHAYQPIVATGKNATTLHYIDNNSRIESGDLILLDVGAEVSYYSADISRTYSIVSPNKRQGDIHKSVMETHGYAISLLKPGVDMKQYEQKVDLFMAGQLKSLGLLDDVNDKRKLKKYYPHLTSHFLGLDTHDSSDYKLPLSPGMVLTVEPGIYIPEEGLGVRIEDDVLITDGGAEILSSDLSRELY